MSTEQHIVHRVIEEARGLIQKGWTTGVMARDEHGNDVDPMDLLACQWCLIGATYRAIVILTGIRDRNHDTFKAVLRRVMGHLRGLIDSQLGFDQLNDQLGRQVVLDILSLALVRKVEEFEDDEPACT